MDHQQRSAILLKKLTETYGFDNSAKPDGFAEVQMMVYKLCIKFHILWKKSNYMEKRILEHHSDFLDKPFPLPSSMFNQQNC